MNQSPAQSWQELFKRAASLGFAAVYTHVHSSERASALRVAYLAYRFMEGDDADQINKDADHAQAIREAQRREQKEQEHQKPDIRVSGIFRLIRKKK